jgi:hypothetical protein
MPKRKLIKPKERELNFNKIVALSPKQKEKLVSKLSDSNLRLILSQLKEIRKKICVRMRILLIE